MYLEIKLFSTVKCVAQWWFQVYFDDKNMQVSQDWTNCVQARCKSENLNEEDALRLQLETHAMSAVIQEVLQPQELHPT